MSQCSQLVEVRVVFVTPEAGGRHRDFGEPIVVHLGHVVVVIGCHFGSFLPFVGWNRAELEAWDVWAFSKQFRIVAVSAWSLLALCLLTALFAGELSEWFEWR